MFCFLKTTYNIIIMSLAMFAASINDDINESGKYHHKSKKFNKTQRHKTDKVNTVLETLQNIDSSSSSSTENLEMGDYSSVEEAGPAKHKNYHEHIYPMEPDNSSNVSGYDGGGIVNEAFCPMTSIPQDSSSVLLKKVNYLISLMESSQDEKTSNTTEEVVLYFFLGIFIIFIVDSFVRVGKYIR